MSKTTYTASQFGAHFANNNIAATDEVLAGMGQLLAEAAKRNTSNPEIAQGFLFEIIEATRFNQAHAEIGSPLRAVITSAIGKPHDVADILIVDGQKIVEKIQAKSSSTGLNCVKEIWKKYDKYQSENGLSFVVPKDKFDRTIELAQKRGEAGSVFSEKYKGISQNTHNRLEKNGIGSPGTTYNETLSATKDPSSFVLKEEIAAVGKESISTACNAAKVGAVFSGVISTVKNLSAVSKGTVSGKDAIKNVACDAGKGAAKSGATGGLSSVIRYGGSKSGIVALKKSNVATALAAFVIESGVITYAWAKGEISDSEALEKLGIGGTSTISSVFSGTAAGMAFGPVGALVGSIGGFIVSSSIYSACVAVAKNAQIQTEYAKKLEIMVQELECRLKQECDAFKLALEKALREKEIVFEKSISSFNSNLIQEEPLKAVDYLTTLSYDLGTSLRFKNFQEFDSEMKEKTTLKI